MKTCPVKRLAFSDPNELHYHTHHEWRQRLADYQSGQHGDAVLTDGGYYCIFCGYEPEYGELPLSAV